MTILVMEKKFRFLYIFGAILVCGCINFFIFFMLKNVIKSENMGKVEWKKVG